ncbi:hypothetical protein LUZ61_017289 [Rhynchospora tenuis]|uniref:Uncharacterized protein n=1 Tax=Rhynchospora tenuis TaxID=198213 RepID=A0AAD6EKV4_9POAL|nr:hypothetical protein LUZ61_017289 [Rhynchospora tenuis]
MRIPTTVSLGVSLLLAFACSVQAYDFFYFVQQWPGSYCDTSSGCCYPTYGKPQSDFAIYGFWPYYANAIFPNGGSYMLDSIITALTSCLGHVPGIGCNQDTSGRYQLYLVYLCINPSGTLLMDCPVYPSSGCSSSVVYFPSF